jgi:hypothetical protein
MASVFNRYRRPTYPHFALLSNLPVGTKFRYRRRWTNNVYLKTDAVTAFGKIVIRLLRRDGEPGYDTYWASPDSEVEPL